ncbi:MAG: hypothetical protein ACRDYD_11955 [Acidimicrobiales bacterium]
MPEALLAVSATTARRIGEGGFAVGVVGAVVLMAAALLGLRAIEGRTSRRNERWASLFGALLLAICFLAEIAATHYG